MQVKVNCFPFQEPFMRGFIYVSIQWPVSQWCSFPRFYSTTSWFFPFFARFPGSQAISHQHIKSITLWSPWSIITFAVMTHPTQAVPENSTWEHARGTTLHLSNCIVVIEIWKPSVRPRFSSAPRSTLPSSWFCSFKCLQALHLLLLHAPGFKGHSGVATGFESPLSVMNFWHKNVFHNDNYVEECHFKTL